MDINALLSPYARSGGGTTADAPLEAAVGSYLDAIEETPARAFAPTHAVVEEIVADPAEAVVETAEETAAVDAPASDYSVAGTHLEEPPAFTESVGFREFEEIAAFDQIDEIELAAIEEPVLAYAGKHRADIPADSLSPLVPVAATHRLSA